ncbi:ornithine carbamoyltransferase [Phytobacter sp. RSE-02]|uniref:DUF6950 family protein n=1 Tax=Phytobacter sp. RSE-02 TaxID=3229229 RepID=UPI00339D9063
MNLHNQLMDIIQYAIDNPHKLCDNDCNMTVLKVIDLFAGTTFSDRKYKTIKAGIKGLNTDGWDHTGQIVQTYCDEVTHTIDGDIWLDSDNPLTMGVVVSGRLLGIDDKHEHFQLIQKPTDGKYYRVRKT